jgi:hypothetical protein
MVEGLHFLRRDQRDGAARPCAEVFEGTGVPSPASTGGERFGGDAVGPGSLELHRTPWDGTLARGRAAWASADAVAELVQVGEDRRVGEGASGEALLHVVGALAEEKRGGEDGERFEDARAVYTIGKRFRIG